MSNAPHSVKTIGRSGLWSVSNQLTGQILSLAAFLVTARFVSKEDFGIMATAMIVVEFFRQFLIESISTTIWSRKEATPEDYNAAFYIVVISSAASALLVFSLAYPIADLFGRHEIASSVQWIAGLLLTMGLSKIHETWLVKHLQFKTLVFRSMCSIVLGGGVGIWMAVNGYGLASLIVQQIVTAVASLIWLWTASPWRPSRNVRWENVKSILAYWKFLAVNSIISQVSVQGDTAFSSYYLGPAATGVYNAAKRMLAAMSMVISGGINNVALPALASLAKDKATLRASFLTCVMSTTLITAPLYIGLGVMSEDIIGLLMGDKWKDVAPVLSVLVISAFLNTLSVYDNNVILIEGKAHWQPVIGLFSATMNVLLLVIFARYGLVPLAWALAVRVLITSSVITWLTLRILDLRLGLYLRELAPPIAFSMIMAAFIAYGRMLADLPAWGNLLVFVPLGAAIYGALYFVFDKRTLLTAFDMVRQTLGRSKAA